MLAWDEDFKTNVGKYVPGVLIGNKSDLIEEEHVDAGEIDQVAATLGVTYLETSAKTGDHVLDAFRYIAALLAEKSGSSGLVHLHARIHRPEFHDDALFARKGSIDDRCNRGEY